MNEIRRRLKDRLQKNKILVAPGVYDALTAMLCEQTNFEAAYLTGAGVSYTTLGKSDVGLITMTEMASKAGYICESVNIPVIADGDNGYGNAINVMRTVKEYERAGVAAIQLEDQSLPKRCGHLANKIVISAEEMMGKICAAVDARTDQNFLIIARTDARATHGLEEAIERGQMYREAGADIIFVEAPLNEEEMKKIAGSIDAPLLANMVEGGKTPMLPANHLEQIGFRLAIFPNSVTRIIAWAARKFYRQLKETGSTESCLDRMIQFGELNQILGIEEFRRLEQKYNDSNFSKTTRTEER